MTCKVQVQPSGHEFTVKAGESVLDAALRQGVMLPYGCRNGTCGSCKGILVAGQVDYQGNRPAALTETEQAAGVALFCQARPQGDVIIEVQEAVVQDFQVKKLPARVARKEVLAPDVMRLYLKLPAAQRLQFLAGQYIDFLLPDGRHRSFSLANAPHDDEFIELHVRHVEKGEFTEYVFDYMKEKSMVRIEGPHGDFYLREDSPRPIILVAGGTGFAPIKGIIEHAFAAGVGRAMHLYWGARAKVDLYLNNLPRQWLGEYANFSYTSVLSAPAETDKWQGRRGYVHEAVVEDYADLGGYDVYAAGPPAMVRATRDACVAHGLPLQQFYSDPFEFAPDAVAKQQQTKP
jgi:CDP-4-dehydro-6-deoxyglucose reductase